MTHAFKLARRMARLRAAVLALLVGAIGACAPDSLDPSTDATTAVDAATPGVEAQPVDNPAFASALAGRGLPFGFWRLEYTQRNFAPWSQVGTLRTRVGNLGQMALEALAAASTSA